MKDRGHVNVTGSMLYPPAENDIWSLRALLIEWFEASREA